MFSIVLDPTFVLSKFSIAPSTIQWLMVLAKCVFMDIFCLIMVVGSSLFNV